MAIISSNLFTGPLEGDGSTTVFSFSFSVVSGSDVRVERNGLPVPGIDYSVTIVSESSGTVTFGTAPGDGDRIMILLDPDYLQTSEFADQGGYNLSTVNTINRRTAIKALATENKARRALKVPLGEEIADLPAEADRAGALLAFDEDGGPDTSRTLAAFDASVSSAAGSATAAAGSASAAAASATAAALDRIATGEDALLTQTALDLINAYIGQFGILKRFDTKAAMITAIATIAANEAVLVWADETHGGRVTFWQKTAGVMVLKADPFTTSAGSGELTLEQYGGVANISEATARADTASAALNNAAMLSVRAAVAAIITNNPEAWVTLKLRAGMCYGLSNVWSFVGIDGLDVDHNGAMLVNTNVGTGSPYDFERSIAFILGGFNAFVGAPSPEAVACGLNVGAEASSQAYYINAATAGQRQITCTTASDASHAIVGRWIGITSDVSYPGGYPGSFKAFDLVKVLTSNATTGVVTFARKLTHNYDPTLPTSFTSGNAPSRASFTPLSRCWDVRQRHRNAVIATAYYVGSYVTTFVVGRDVELINCKLPGVTVGACDQVTINGFDYSLPDASPIEMVDKFAKRVSFKNGRVKGITGGDGSGGFLTFESVRFDGPHATYRSVSYKDCTFADDLNMTFSRALSMEGCECYGAIGAYAAAALTVDGTVVTYSAGVITAPTAYVNADAYQFFSRIYVGCVLGEAYGAPYLEKPAYGVVTSITESGANLLIGINWSGGAIPNGTVLLSPQIEQYRGVNNRGGIPNGDVDDFLGNRQHWIISPRTNAVANTESFLSREFYPNGEFQKIRVNVIKPYTGALYGGGMTLVLTVLPNPGYKFIVDLTLAGEREILRSGSRGSQGVDTIGGDPKIEYKLITATLNGASGGGGALNPISDAQQLLPIVEVDIEFKKHRIGRLVLPTIAKQGVPA
ncbi:MAG: hypothetical protein JWN66_3083 [Sphingomonas bacterium]|uniref:hypothetical protein n=1 Tax=Sphingomonas bacterium TaxID=1895847 RepID=UPI002601BA2B|nr:hypothetical protein [Sphingomonas bacterium]MDB5705967.1 hypothetical protein [Sphingomonas bacterium]